MTKGKALNDEQRRLLETLLHDVGPRLLGYVRRAFGAGIEAEEIVAETFSRAADNIEALAASGRQDLYLLTTARNICRDLFRKHRPGLLTEQQSRSQPDRDGTTPADRIESREDRARLLAAVDALPPAQREVVTLRLSAELKFEEIADLLSIPLGTALSRMDAAMKNLKKAMGSENVAG